MVNEPSYPAGRPIKGENGADLRKAIGSRITALRRCHNMLQQELAVRLGVNAWMVSRYEAGTYCPRIETFLRLRSIFPVTVDFLLTGEETGEVSDRELLRRAPRIQALAPELKPLFYQMLDTFLSTYGGSDGMAP